MSGKVDAKLSELVKKFFSPEATHFDKQEAIIGFMAHLRFPIDKAACELVFSLYDAQYKSAYILENGYDEAIKNGLDIETFCENVFSSTLIPAARDDLGLYDVDEFHLNSILATNTVAFLLAYDLSGGKRPSIKKAHYYFKKFTFSADGSGHDYAWRVFSRNWTSYKSVSFYLLANVDSDDMFNFDMLKTPVLGAVDEILLHPDRFEIFLRKSRYVFDHLKRILDRRATERFSFPKLPASFEPIPMGIRSFEEGEISYMKGYNSLHDE